MSQQTAIVGLYRLFNFRQGEVLIATASFAFVFVLMTAYYLLRPLRDAMASDWSDAEVATLWTLNFFLSTALVAVLGWVNSRLKASIVVPGVYLFFAFSFLVFYLLANPDQVSADTVLIRKAFYLWISVFALFHLSVFWSFTSGVYSQEQAARLFSFIAAGASIGALCGPILSGLLINQLGYQGLLLLAAGLLLLPLPLIAFVRRRSSHLVTYSAPQRPGGTFWEGFAHFFSSRYLLGIGVFIFLYTMVSSFVYFEQKNLLAPFSLEQRTLFLSYRDIIINGITLLLAFFVTGKLVPKLGMAIALSLVPLVILLGLLWLSLAPLLLVAMGIWVVRSAGNYGLVRPAREMLFTKMSAADRYKTKPVIDIVAYRGGDVLSGWLFAGLTQGIGLGLGMVALVGAAISALWLALAVYLGRRFTQD